MLGPTTLALMLLPAVLGVGISFLLPRQMFEADRVVAGAWLVFLALPAAVAFDQARPHVADPVLLNRVEAVVLGGIAGAFVLINRRSAGPTVISAWLIAVGVWLNALAVLVYGYMPVLQSAAAIADKPFSAAHPSPAYVRSEDLSWFGVIVGDFIPIPQGHGVLSVGDLALLAGCVLLLAVFFAGLWRSDNGRVTAPAPAVVKPR